MAVYGYARVSKVTQAREGESLKLTNTSFLRNVINSLNNVYIL